MQGHRRRNGMRLGRRLDNQIVEDVLTLDQVDAGSTVRVVSVHGGRRLVHRLAALGIVPGSLVTVKRSRGPSILALNGTRLAVGRHAAMAIEVEVAEA